MVNFFVAGSQVVRWELAAVDSGVYRLSIFHDAGRIVEYFTSTDEALRRERQIEALFLGSRGAHRLDQ